MSTRVSTIESNDTVVGHRKNGDLSDGTVTPLDTASAFIDGGQIGVHVTRETTTTRHLLSGSRHLTQGLSIRRHVGQDDQHVLLALVGEVLGSGQGETRSNDTLDGWVVGEIEEKGHTKC
jgi:hypothetical protein